MTDARIIKLEPPPVSKLPPLQGKSKAFNAADWHNQHTKRCGMTTTSTSGRLIALHIASVSPDNVDDMPTPYWVKCAFVSLLVMDFVSWMVG